MTWNITSNETPVEGARAHLLEFLPGAAPQAVWDQAGAVAGAVESLLSELGSGPFYVSLNGDDEDGWISVSIRKGNSS